MTEMSPLAEIERSVQARARDLGLDPRAPGSDSALNQLINEEVRRWNLDFKRGMRPRELYDASRIAERARRDLLGYGPLEPLLDDDDVWEIMVNAPHKIFVKRHQGPSGYHDEAFHDDEHVRRTLTRILDDASGSHRKLDPSEGLQDAQLDNGARLHIVHDDIGRGGHLIFNVRKFTGVAFATLEELTLVGTLTPQIADFLRAAVRAQRSILFAGAPGSGKTTLLRCCAAELDPSLRVVTAEEVFEVEIPLPNVASMQTRPSRAERSPVDLRRLVSGFLRMAPDVAVVGEVRDREAVPLLLTLSSGVTGYATIHAGSARQALARLRLMCQISPEVRGMPVGAISQLIADSIDIVVHLRRSSGGVRISEILALEGSGADSHEPRFAATTLYGNDAADTTIGTEQTPARAVEPLPTVVSSSGLPDRPGTAPPTAPQRTVAPCR